MKAFAWISIVCIIYSCSKESNNVVIKTFPKVLVYDTFSIIKTEVYNSTGKLINYDAKFDEFDYTPSWLFDSIKLINNSVAYSYKYIQGRFNDPFFQIDTLNIVLHEDNFQTIPLHFPDSILILDTKIINDIKVSGNMTEIKSAVTRSYLVNGEEFVMPLLAVRVFGTGSMIGQFNVNKVDRESLYKNLKSDETLSIISYELVFKIK